MRTIIILLLSGLSAMTATAQSQETKQLLLNVEKLTQFKQILSDMKKGYEVLSKGYNTVRDLSQGNFSLHKTFLDGLMEVSPAVKKYRKVAEIINCQLLLVKETKRGVGQFQGKDVLNPGELDYIGKVHGRLLTQSLENLDDLVMVVTAGKLRMSDDERIREIDRISEEMQDKLNFLNAFNRQSTILGIQRSKELLNIRLIEKQYGLQN